ncbi:DeoR/GlpR family DNA-binding transcription regulator [Lichenicoccus roseus]|uniref:DeoR/GlpR family DNA-binding transcription regulator n=1 Tax=Lichenicoccus roseus TaxID=2683649 RepID=UPI001487210C|nr:DeoR/GlpR family DNA-binding transcription regulator [Lichenicoccus roseus]
MDDVLLIEAAQDESGANLPAARQSKLVELVTRRGQVSAGELVSLFGVSRDTIRRDLTLLEERGLLVRTHGGAVPRERLVTSSITTLDSRMNKHQAAKQRIARAATRLLRPRETLMLNGGSTIACFAAALGDLRDLTIVTNSVHVPTLLPETAVRAVYVLGGTYIASSQVMVGFAGFAAMPQISVDTAVIGVSGLSARGCSISKLEEATATKEMMAACERTILLADSSKFDLQAFALVADFERVEYLVTDAGPEGELAAALEEAGVKIVVAQ